MLGASAGSYLRVQQRHHTFLGQQQLHHALAVLSSEIMQAHRVLRLGACVVSCCSSVLLLLLGAALRSKLSAHIFDTLPQKEFQLSAALWHQEG